MMITTITKMHTHLSDEFQYFEHFSKFHIETESVQRKQDITHIIERMASIPPAFSYFHSVISWKINYGFKNRKHY